MENCDLNKIKQLREWSPLTDLLEKIPAKIQRGLFSYNFNITCVDILPDFIALGTDIGIVLWYNRTSGDLKKLRCEQLLPITCLRIISSVEYMVAAGMQGGQVNVFQIQKEHPSDLDIVTPLKPIERYIIKDLNLDDITALEWSKNGMKLFSGDRRGLIILTEFDFVAHISKSIAIINEAYGIVQIGFIYPWLIVSSIYRSIVCVHDISNTQPAIESAAWKVTQIGTKDRKMLSKFGAVFTGMDRRAPNIICSRPGFRFWMADTDGNVSHTYLLKDAVTKQCYEVPLLNPCPSLATSSVNHSKLLNFGPCYNYNDVYILTHNENTILIINLKKLTVEATIKRLRKIQYLAVCGWEIFVLEGGRSLIRISIAPEQINGGRFGSIVYNAKYVSEASSTSRPKSPIEFEEEQIFNADECFELPPIKAIYLETPIQANNSSFSKQEKLLMEHSRKVEVFERINKLEYDNSILFKTETHKSKKKKPKPMPNGIVEVGQQALPYEEPTSNISTNLIATNLENSTGNVEREDGKAEEPEAKFVGASVTTTKSTPMEESICHSDGPITDGNTGERDSTQSSIDTKQAESSCSALEMVRLESKSLEIKPTIYSLPPVLPEIAYRTNYPHIDDEDIQIASIIKKIHFIDDKNQSTNSNDENKRSNQMTNQDVQNDQPAAYAVASGSMSQSLNFVSAQISPDAPAVRKIPDYMRIPNLWNVRLEHDIDNERGDSSSGSGSSREWEFI